MRELMWSGKIPYVRPSGGRKIFFEIVDLDKFVEKTRLPLEGIKDFEMGINRVA